MQGDPTCLVLVRDHGWLHQVPDFCEKWLTVWCDCGEAWLSGCVMVELVVMSVAPLFPWALALVLLVWAFALVLLPDASVQSLQLPDARLEVL